MQEGRPSQPQLSLEERESYHSSVNNPRYNPCPAKEDDGQRTHGPHSLSHGLLNEEEKTEFYDEAEKEGF